MTAATMSTNALDALSQPPSQASSPSATSSSFPNQQTLPSRAVLNAALQSARSQQPMPPTPTSGAHSGTILDLPSGTKYADFLRTWNDNHVSKWLADIKCAHHANTFKANDIRGDVLLELEQNTLKEMGVASIGDRLRILNAVKALRQKCSTRRAERLSLFGSARTRNSPAGASADLTHNRSDSASSPTSTRSGRRLDHGRPAPLQLNPNAAQQANLPGLDRDTFTAPDSARSIRPLPQPAPPVSSSASHTPGTGYSSSSRQPAHLPPPPRGQPPPPPIRSSSRNHHPGASDRRTPTQLETLPDYTSQPLPPAPGLLTPQSANNWSGYGLPPDPRAGLTAGSKTPSRSQSPLPNVPSRSSARSPNPAHGRNISTSSIVNNTTPATKLSARPSTAGSHPYSQGLQPPQQANTILSPIAESFMTNGTNTQVASSASPLPPTYTVGRGPFNRPNTPSYNVTPSLVDLRRKLIKFQLADEGHSSTINVEDCPGGIEVLEKALKKFGKLGGRGTDTDSMMERAGTDDGGLSVDGWGVYLDWRHDGSPGEFFLSCAIDCFTDGWLVG